MSKQCTRRQFLTSLAAGGAAYALAGCGARPKPNFVFILADDLGWRDLSCYGSDFYETPNIDRLAAEGMRFTDAYAACPVCSPTRASILTGKYPARLHLTDWIAGFNYPDRKLLPPEWTMYLDTGEITIAEALGAADYVSASVGKWHLGGEDYWPEKQGFAVNIAGTHAGSPPTYFSPYRGANGNGIATLAAGPEGEYLTDRLTDEALAWMEDNRDRPFFLYLSHFAVHIPIEAKEAIAAAYRAKADDASLQHNPEYAAMIASVDQSVGRVTDKLHELGIEDNTVVVFFSDNGGLMGNARYPHVTSNDPLRAGKGTAYEGGVREPLIVRWPEVTEPGSVCNEVVTSVDFYPTLLDIAGVAGADGRTPDGVSLTPLLRGGDTLGREAVYWHYPHYHNQGATPFGAVRRGDYRLIEFYEDGRTELYNLAEDIGETRDLSASMPGLTRELRDMLHRWREEVGAQMPRPNPDYRGD